MPHRQLGLVEFVTLMSAMMALIGISIDALLPTLGQIGAELGVANPNDTQFIITLFFLGMVFGEFVFGPVSDAIGRKPAILIGMAIFAAGTVLAMTAVSMEQLLIGRLVQGIGVSGPKCASRALVRDIHFGDAMARIMSLVFMVFILVPMIAPALGQLVAETLGWRAIFAAYLVIVSATAIWLVVRQPETLPPERRIPLSPVVLAVNTGRILRHGRVMAYSVAAGFVFGALLLYIATCQAMFLDLYDIGRQFPLYFALLSVGFGISSFANSRLVLRFGSQGLSLVAAAMITGFAAIFLAITFANGGIPPFAVFMALTFLMFTCLGMLFGNLNALAMEWLGGVAGLGAAMVASVSSLVAVVYSVVLGRYYDETAYIFAAGFLMAGVSVVVLVGLARRSHPAAL